MKSFFFFVTHLLVIFFELYARTKEIGKCEHAGKEGMQGIEKIFKTRVKYYVMFIENVWEAEYFCV